MNMSDFDTKAATMEYAIRLGDDSLIMGHRLSEWCSNAPFLEEDLALSNSSLDYLGRARMYYTYAAELSPDKNKTEDDFAFTRDQREFQNLLIYELPRGNFAFTMMRQFFIDTFNILFLTNLTKSTDKTLAAIAAKAIKETRYHLRRSTEWIAILGDGTEESHNKAQEALNALWGYRKEMFELDSLEIQLAEQGIGVDNRLLESAWEENISKTIKEATLQLPEEEWAVRGGRIGYHTENLGHLLTELQFVHRSMPGCKW
jgi:ring-1,2-phenylacetyl-CoA epoxidase subunit PaaC